MFLFGVILVCIQSESGKRRTRITPNTDTFYAVAILFICLQRNCMMFNIDNSHLSLSTKIEINANIDGNKIEPENKEELSLEDHVNSMCKKASQKLNALSGIAS